MPEFTSNTTVIWQGKKNKVPVEFIATVALGFTRKLEGRDTGNYICKNTNNPLLSVYYYLYIPGKSLFVSPGGTIPFSIYDPVVRIPCSLTNPHAHVTLQKSVHGVLQCPLNDSITYNIKSGFHMHLTEDDEKLEPGGHYVCTAGYNNSFQLIEFTLEANQPGVYTNLADESINGTESLETNTLGRSENSCEPSPCGSNSICRTLPGRNFPHCKCIPGFYGRPPNCKRESESMCERNVCGPNSICRDIPGRNYPSCSCKPNYYGRPPKCRPECHLTSDCTNGMMCVNQRCQDPCNSNPGHCGEGALCSVTDNIVVCSCPMGWSGDPLKKCGRNRMPSITYFPTLEDSEQESEQERPIRPERPQRHPCEPWPCGPLSECKPVGNKAHCSCASGYVGSPPNCRPECRIDIDCSRDQACLDNKCRNACSTAQLDCGRVGKCLTVNHKADCYCPNYRGGPLLVPCTHQQLQQNYVEPTPKPSPVIMFPTHHNPILGISEDEIDYPKPGVQQYGNPCTQTKNPCGIRAICTHKNQTIGCKCQIGYTAPGSDPYKECRASGAPCDVCGQNSQCEQLPDGQYTCTCKPGYIGNPPHCRDNFCVMNEDCPSNTKCSRGYCVDPCGTSQCVEESVCRTIQHTAVCACLNSPDSDPFLSCSLKGGKVPFGAE